MMQRVCFVWLVLASALGFGGQAAAQQKPLPISLQATVGARMGAGGTYDSYTGAAIGFTIGVPLRKVGAGTLIGAAAVGAQSSVLSSEHCIVLRDQPNRCVPDFPTLVSLGLLGGVQRGSTAGFSAHALAGPVFYRAHSISGGGNALGLQGRLEFATPTLFHTAPIFSLRSSLIPRFAGETPVGYGSGDWVARAVAARCTAPATGCRTASGTRLRYAAPP